MARIDENWGEGKEGKKGRKKNEFQLDFFSVFDLYSLKQRTRKKKLCFHPEKIVLKVGIISYSWFELHQSSSSRGDRGKSDG